VNGVAMTEHEAARAAGVARHILESRLTSTKNVLMGAEGGAPYHDVPVRRAHLSGSASSRIKLADPPRPLFISRHVSQPQYVT
jgi:hypothetical protein